MNSTRTWITCLSLLIPGILSAAGNANRQEEQNIRIIMTEDAGAELQLEARQAPLAQVLNRIATQTGMRINYSVLPEGLVTATCVGPTVKQVLECLLAQKADLIFRYPSQTAKTDSPRQPPAEAWILGAKFDVNRTNPETCLSTEAQQQTMLKMNETKTHTFQIEPEPDKTDELVKMAKSENPAERAEAVGRLMAAGRKGDASVKEALEAALTDEDATVRVRALTSLSYREGSEAATAVREAIHDKDERVRLTAVGRAGDDVALLQQALTDEAEMVRKLAAIKLESISKTNVSQ
ncbi:HEAT repeat domain-containing protein [Methylobacter sp. YRD-M1]|uniref:HEAT repeat domain-containing protein n=1 Tax=Methylobacter sp. YRD-M1 TaxID=2911520 RepID=UPI00227B4834|nr:HEAT repeat domain-containing protein [Methylobacter sp. YRD-M1]WAK01468.1 HEAT repeat domain-containing protein [Methylobacter sp. YRD-M1]